MRRRDARSEPGSLRSVRDLGLLLFVAAALVVGLIHFSLARDSGGASADASTASAPSSSASRPSASPSPSPSVSSSAPATASGSAPGSPQASGPVATVVAPTSGATVPAASCWNGDHAARLAQCPLPSGEAGLRWVFPSLDSTALSCHPAPRPAGPYRTVIGVECFAQVAGQPVTVTFEQVASTAAAAVAIQRSFPIGERYRFAGARGGRTTWFDPAGRPARAAGSYAGYPYVVSLVTARPQLAKQAWASLVSFRPPGSVPGTRG